VKVALALFMLLTAQAAVPPTQAPAAPVPVAPVVTSPDPANSAFAGVAGIILVTIKPTAIADYELVIRTLQGVLAKDTDPVRKAATKNWRVFKASTGDAKGNGLYVHVILPVVAGFDYRPSLLVDALVKDLAPDLLTKYQDAFAAPPSKLDLNELANMAVAPLPVPAPEVKPAEVKKPGR
jgi:hypothetical protein